MQIGTTKDQGLYNKPSVGVHPGALAAGTLIQYNTIQCRLPEVAAASGGEGGKGETKWTLGLTHGSCCHLNEVGGPYGV